MTLSRARAVVVAVVLALAALPISLLAKGPTVKLTISGAALPRAIEVTDATVLSRSNVYEGAFIGASAAAPDSALPVYTVAFDVQLPEWMKAGVRTMYAVQVVKDPRSNELRLYLPGRGEPGYPLNVGTILRDGKDGHWRTAAAPWASRLTGYLP